jgi:hypothetical protein
MVLRDEVAAEAAELSRLPCVAICPRKQAVLDGNCGTFAHCRKARSSGEGKTVHLPDLPLVGLPDAGESPRNPHVLTRTPRVGDTERDCGLAYLSLHP